MDNDIKRFFHPGDNWLYYKIYTGQKSADEILTNLIGPLVLRLKNEKIITKWFFIRYSDPRFHLRVRFHCVSKEHVGEVINYFFSSSQKYFEEDLIWNVNIDTYQREIERYGGFKTIELAEDLFCTESDMIVKFLRLIEEIQSDELRWLFSLKAIDSLLESFNYSLKEKKTILFKLSTAFRKEFGDTKNLKKQLSKKLRNKKNKIEGFMKPELKIVEHQLLLKLLEDNKIATDITIKKILSLYKNKVLKINLDDLLSSFIHMLMNRLFRSNNRKYELVCYDLLAHYYQSLIARNNQKSNLLTN